MTKGLCVRSKSCYSGYADGIITSGSYSPTLEKSIALARVPVETGDEVMVDIRGKLVPAKVGKPRIRFKQIIQMRTCSLGEHWVLRLKATH